MEGWADPHPGGQSPPQEASGARACRCPAMRVSLTTSNVGTLRGTHRRRHMAMVAGVRGAGQAAQQQREGRQSYTGDGARGAGLHGFGNRDERSFESAVLRMWSKN